MIRLPLSYVAPLGFDTEQAEIQSTNAILALLLACGILILVMHWKTKTRLKSGLKIGMALLLIICCLGLFLSAIRKERNGAKAPISNSTQRRQVTRDVI